MLRFSSKTLLHLRFPASFSSLPAFNNLFWTKSVVKSSDQSENNSFVVSYLEKNCGFDPQKAISASKYLKFETTDRPDSVLAFLKSHGFSESQILKAVQRFPPLLLCDPEKRFLPKIEFLKGLGFETDDFTHILCLCPGIFKTNMENTLLPTVYFLRNFFHKNSNSTLEKIRVPIRRCPQIVFPSTRALVEQNIRVLIEMGVPEKKLAVYVQFQPRLFMKQESKFRKILEEVKGLGLDPSAKTFMVGVHIFCSMNKSTWEKKIGFYKKWGLTEDKILVAFRKSPYFMSCSEEKILELMDFLVNTMGFKPSDVSDYPGITMFSVKKRISPRCLVYQTLLAEGLLSKNIKLLVQMLTVPEPKFLTKYVQCYNTKFPKLLELYESACFSG